MFPKTTYIYFGGLHNKLHFYWSSLYTNLLMFKWHSFFIFIKSYIIIYSFDFEGHIGPTFFASFLLSLLLTETDLWTIATTSMTSEGSLVSAGFAVVSCDSTVPAATLSWMEGLLRPLLMCWQLIFWSGCCGFGIIRALLLIFRKYHFRDVFL